MKKLIKISFILLFFLLLILASNSVYGAEDFQIKITPTNKNLTTSNVILNIEVSTTRVFDSLSNQAVQILLGEESETNKWSDLGSGKNAIALKRIYNYTIKSNCKVKVRIVSWSMEDKSDLQELATEEYDVSNIDKVKPVIEKIDVTSTTNNSISLEIVAKDLESGIAKYTCSCDAISFNKTDVNPKFEVTGLEENKEYLFSITVEDKIGNKITKPQTIKTKGKETTTVQPVTPVNQTEQQNTTQPAENTSNVEVADNVINNGDNTTSNKKLPEVGTKDFIAIIALLGLITYIIIKTKDRN